MQVERFPVGSLQANCWLVWDEQGHGVLIDPGDEAPRLLQALKQRQLALDAILLTHAHFDHMMAVPALQAATGAPLLVHEGEREALTDGTKSLTVWAGRSCELTADRLLKEGDTVTVGDLRFAVWHTPGHTPGSCCFLAEGYLFSGDTLFAGTTGRTDFPGGSGTALRESLRRLSGLPEDVVLCPGHEGNSTIGRERKTNPFLVGL